MSKRLLRDHPISIDLGLLILRIGTGALLLTHGWPKLMNYSSRASKFSDPFGLGSEASLVMAIFAEVFCSALIILGLYTRLALIPLLITMLTIVLIVHGSDPFQKKELALLFLIPFLTLFLTGPGRFSIDGMRK